MTSEELQKAFEHHCLSKEPSLFCEPLKWWKERKAKKEEMRMARMERGLSNPPSFLLHPYAWFDWWFFLQEGQNYSNFKTHSVAWEFNFLQKWHRYRMTPEKPPDPHILWVVDKILKELQENEEKKDTQDQRKS